MSDSNFDPMIRDVDESLKQDRLRELWDEYGSSLVTSAVALVIFTALFSGWNSYQARQNRLETQNYIQALNADDKGETLAKTLPELDGGVKAVALLKQAAIAREAGDEAQVAASYKALADDNSAPEIYTDLGTLLFAMTALSSEENAAQDDVIARLQSLSEKDDSPWRSYAALVLAATQAQNSENAKEAAARLEELATLDGTPFALEAEARALSVFYKRQNAASATKETTE